MRALVSLVSLVGCAGEPLPVHVARDLPGGWDTVQLAGAAMGLEVEHSDRRYGAVTVSFVEAPAGEVLGKEDGQYCAPALWVVVDEVALAHELGHALGLGHTDDPQNLMYPSRPVPMVLTDEQQAVVDENARKLTRCR